MKTFILVIIFVLTFANSLAIGYYNNQNNEFNLELVEVETAKMAVIVSMSERIKILERRKRVPVF